MASQEEIGRDPRRTPSVLGRMQRLTAMDIFLYMVGAVVGLPLVGAAAIEQLGPLTRSLSLIAGITIIGIIIYGGLGTKPGETDGGG